jgi:hypothetical protein
MLSYQEALPLSSRTLTFTARLIRAHRAGIGSRRRILDPAGQAQLTLVYLHQGHTYEQLVPGFGISRATAAASTRPSTCSPGTHRSSGLGCGRRKLRSGFRDPRADRRCTGDTRSRVAGGLQPVLQLRPVREMPTSK